MIQGVDYSRTPHSDWAGLAAALKAQGKQFAWRYCVNDKSPLGRGISAAEYAEMSAAGIEIGLYWESTEGWMLDGFQAGVAAAHNAQANILSAGMPPTIPVYFACDIDATPDQQAAIDDCLRGCASVIGAARVGIYGGYWIVSRCAANGTAKWFAQTSAWSGGQWFEGNHLEQYAYNHTIEGVDCDDVRALKPNYGQASLAHIPPPPIPQPAPKPAPNTVPGIPLPVGVSVQLLERLYTGSPDNKLIIGGQAVSFDPNDEVSRAWLTRCIASIPHGKAWREGSWPPIKDRIHRGVNGKDGTDYLLGDGHIIHADAHGHVAA